MAPRRFVLMVVGLTSLVLLLIAAVNVVADPGSIYLKKFLTRSEFDLYASVLSSTTHGLKADGWNERKMNVAKAKRAASVQCAVLGSSHVMYVSSHRRPSVTGDYCRSLINMGVSGGSLEDVAISLQVMVSEETLPERVIIGIDPWTLHFDSDSRWREHEAIYGNALVTFGAEGAIRPRQPYWAKVTANLLNLEYLTESLALLRKTGIRTLVGQHVAKFRSDSQFAADKLRPLVVESLDYERGGEVAVTLPDGSHMSARSSLEHPEVPWFDRGYKITDGQVDPARAVMDPKAVALLVSMVRKVRASGVEIAFLLTPYHPNVWAAAESRTVPVMREVSAAVRDIGAREGIPVFGSFDPADVGCGPSEFFDYMHPRPTCLRRIFAQGDQ